MIIIALPYLINALSSLIPDILTCYPNIYIYIYIYRERERERERSYLIGILGI